MNYDNYIKKIAFKFKPKNKYLWGMGIFINRIEMFIYWLYEFIRHRHFYRLASWLRKLSIWLEVTNTILPEKDKLMKDRLYELLQTPKMSTFTIGAMINKGVSQMADDCCFVNVGVWHGFTFLSGIKDNPDKRCIGIDNFSQWGGDEDGNPREQLMLRFEKYKSNNHYFYDMDYREYFSKIHMGKIGFYMYDGHHSYENQLEGLRIAEPFFSENCFILIDDINWESPRQATLDFLKESKHKYEIILDETTYKHSHLTLWCGIMILQRTK